MMFLKVFALVCAALCFLLTVSTPCGLYNPDGSRRNMKILIFIDSKFMEMFFNWHKFYLEACNSGASNLEIICMDSLCVSILRKYDFEESSQSFELEYNIFAQKLGNVWTKRMEIVNNYLYTGVDLVLTDSDALWLKNPFLSLQVISDRSDFVASRGWWPWPLYRNWGACVCMGFVYIKANPFTRDLFSKIAYILHDQTVEYARQIALNITSNTTVKPDDQLAINNQLYQWNISWQGPKMTVENNSVTDFGTVVRNQTAYTVALLPHHNFVRSCHNQSRVWWRRPKRYRRQVAKNLKQAVVAHCRISTGDWAQKRKYYQSFDLWRLNVTEYNPAHYNITEPAPRPVRKVSNDRFRNSTLRFAFHEKMKERRKARKEKYEKEKRDKEERMRLDKHRIYRPDELEGHAIDAAERLRARVRQRSKVEEEEEETIETFEQRPEDTFASALGQEVDKSGGSFDPAQQPPLHEEEVLSASKIRQQEQEAGFVLNEKEEEDIVELEIPVEKLLDNTESEITF